MAERITRKNVEDVFEIFVKKIGGHVATAYNDMGGYRLDYTACYGGYNVERVVNDGGKISFPFGSSRQGIREMYFTLHFALRVADLMNSRQEVDR